jgi:hypothetical protein
MSINYWTVSDEPEIASWKAEFPLGNMADPRTVLPFVQKVLEAAEREEVYRVQRAPWRSGDLGLNLDLEYRSYPGGPSYGQYLEQVLNKTDKLISFPQLSSSPGYLPEYRVIAPAKLGYYDLDGELMIEEVEDVGALLRRIRPIEYDLPDYWRELSEEELTHKKKIIDKSYKAEGSAIFFSGTLWPKDYWPAQSTYLFINLYTDIWFPKVGGYLEDHSPAQSRVFHDNRALAMCHTPRLNRFLASVRELTLEFDGIWKVDYPTYDEQYNQQFDENGIHLDI